MTPLAPPMEPSEPAEWLAEMHQRIRDYDEAGKARTYAGHFARTMAENCRNEIETSKLPHYFERTHFEP